MSNKLLTDETGQAIAQALRELDTVALQKIGTLTSLNTSNKASLVAAINELLTQRGALSSLNTTSKTSIIAAINELVNANSTKTDKIASPTANNVVAMDANGNMKDSGLSVMTAQEMKTSIRSILGVSL